MALSRQGLPVWNPAGVPRDAIERGAYVLRESYKGAEPDLILIGTGSEVHICNRAADLLEADGIATRVVSAPCLDRFAEQDEAYRDEVLPPGVSRARFRRGRRDVRLGPLGRRRGPGGRARPLRRVRAAEGPLRALRLHAGGDRRSRQEGGEGMSVQQSGVNQRLAALTEAGTSVWLDQIRRNLIESGSSSGSCARTRFAASRRTRRSSRRRSSARTTTTRTSTRRAEEGLSAKEIYEKHRRQGRAAGGGRPASGLGRERRARRVRLARGLTRPRARHRRGDAA